MTDAESETPSDEEPSGSAPDADGDETKPPPAGDDEEQDERGAVLREYHRVMYQYSFIGIEFGVAIAIGVLLGRWLDGKWGTAPWMMLLGVALGLAAAGKDFVRLVKRARIK